MSQENEGERFPYAPSQAVSSRSLYTRRELSVILYGPKDDQLTASLLQPEEEECEDSNVEEMCVSNIQDTPFLFVFPRHRPQMRGSPRPSSSSRPLESGVLSTERGITFMISLPNESVLPQTYDLKLVDTPCSSSVRDRSQKSPNSQPFDRITKSPHKATSRVRNCLFSRAAGQKELDSQGKYICISVRHFLSRGDSKQRRRTRIACLLLPDSV